MSNKDIDDTYLDFGFEFGRNSHLELIGIQVFGLWSFSLRTHSDPFVPVVDVGAVFLPGDAGLGVSAGGLAFQDRRLPRRHDDIGGVLSEVVSQN